jgi:AmiR/NasT family two-component response regulator
MIGIALITRSRTDDITDAGSIGWSASIVEPIHAIDEFVR